MREIYNEFAGNGEGGSVLISLGTQRLNDASANKSGREVGQVDDVHHKHEAHALGDIIDLRFCDPLVSEIVQAHRQRRRWIKARNSLILQAKAFARAVIGSEGDESKKLANAAYDRIAKGEGVADDALIEMCLIPFLPAIERFDLELKPLERHLEKLAKRLPVAEFVKGIHGVSFGSLAAIVGEAGDLSEYRSIMAVWKRLGLAVIDGERQRKCADKDKAILHGYSPERRSVLWNVGNGLIGGMGLGKRPLVGEDIDLRGDWHPYEKLFVHRLRYEAERNPEHRRPDTKDGKESYSKAAAARAKRYVEKRFLKDLTVEWRRQAGKPTATIFHA